MFSTSTKRPVLPVLGAACGVGLIYILTRSPYLGFGDALGFAYHANGPFSLDTNATSHFLYQNILWLLRRVFFFAPSTPVFVCWSAVMAGLTLWRLDQMGKVWELGVWERAGAVVAMGLSFTWWRQAVTVEVYTTYAFFALSALAALLSDVQRGERARWLAVSLWLALALLTHIQAILLLPVYGIYLLHARARRKMLPAGAALALVTSPLWLLPLAFQTHGLRDVLFEAQYQDQVLAFSVGEFLRGLARSAVYLLYNFHFWVAALGVGVWRYTTGKGKKRMGIFSLLALVPIWLFAARYNVSDNYVFYILPYLLLAPLIGRGVGVFWKKRPPRVRWVILTLALVASPLVYLGVWQVAARWPAAQARAEPKAYKGGLRYYLWPGQAAAADPVALAEEIATGKRKPIPDFERYEAALKFIDE